MRRLILAYISDPTHQVRLWGTLTVVWVVMTPITLLTALAHSLPWLNFLSLFANFASCGTALVAAWSYMRARRVDEAQLHSKLDHIIDSHPDIPPLEATP